eukprot:UN19607
MSRFQKVISILKQKRTYEWLRVSANIDLKLGKSND